jgi:molybdopterin converting factor small subunit
VLRDRIVEEYPQLEALMGTLVVAVDEEMVPTEHVLEDGAKVELIPPIAGG